MEQVFHVNPSDKGLAINFKREANIILASLNPESIEYKVKYNNFVDVLSVIKSIENTEPDQGNITFIINTINRLWETGLLSPLKLTNDEFEENNSNHIVYRNKRYYHIYHTGNGKIYNGNAYNLIVRAAYSHNDKIQLNIKPNKLYTNHNIFISKGGVITGEYFYTCMIRPEEIDKHNFSVQSVVNIPVSEIRDNDKSIFVVDHREPKLKALKEFYIVDTYIDNEIKQKGYNIRKYKKLQKKKYL